MVDILMATYNGEKYIREQIDSIVAQTYKDFRLLIRDDGSSDRTLDIIQEYARKYSQIMLIQDDIKCGSPAANFMQLTKYATADYVMYSDQDDFWMPEKIQITLNKMEEVESNIGKDTPILVYADSKAVNEELRDVFPAPPAHENEKENFELNHMLVHSYIRGCLMMLNRPLYSLLGDYVSDVRMHDCWAALIASAVGEIHHVSKIVLLYRQHTNNNIGEIDVKSLRYKFSRFWDKDTKEIQNQYKRQAELLLERYGNILNEKEQNVLQDFINIFYEKSKMKRIARLIKGQYLKDDLFQRIGQLWYI